MQQYERFRTYWRISNNLPSNEEDMSPLYKTQINTPGVGTMEFLSLRMRQYLGDDFDASIYVPTAASEATYRLIRDKIGDQNEIIFFRERPVR